MSQSILSDQPDILPCPSCGQMIFSNSTKCRFCSADIDLVTAAAGAELQNRVNNACNQAKMIRHMAMATWVFFAFGFIPFVSTLAFFGRLALLVIVPISLIVWQIKYGRLKSADVDYRKAKRDRLFAFVLWLPAAIIQFGVLVLSVLPA